MLFEQLGSSAAEHHVSNVIQRFRDASANGLSMLLDMNTKEQQHLLKIFASIDSFGTSMSLEGRPRVMSPKAERLILMLQEQALPTMRGIIFVKERATAAALTQLLCDAPTLAADYQVGAFVGSSSFDSGRSSIIDLTELKQQKKDLADFRSGAKNLIVATSVLEEGIDVSACNLVVNFDLPDTLIAFIQRRGRARQQGSTYCMFVADNDVKADPLRWQAEEAKMKQEYAQAAHQRAMARSEDEEKLGMRVYRVESTGALLTSDIAKAHLHHFCSVSTLQASNYVAVRPEFTAHHSTIDGLWSAEVTLPSFVHPEVRTASSSQRWRSEAAAIKDAAFESYVALHKAGLVNDNLLPLVKELPSGKSSPPILRAVSLVRRVLSVHNLSQ